MPRAYVDENKETTNTKIIGLINHNGTEPMPPGFPERAASAPPPGMRNPGSVKNLLGLTIASKEYGAFTANGTNTSADLFVKRSNHTLFSCVTKYSLKFSKEITMDATRAITKLINVNAYNKERSSETANILRQLYFSIPHQS